MLDCYKTKRKRDPIEYPEGPGGPDKCTKTAAGLREYRSRTEAMWDRQMGICTLCELPMSIEECTYDHSFGRGMGGGHRDDRIWIDGEPHNSAVHFICNGIKGSRRVA